MTDFLAPDVYFDREAGVPVTTIAKREDLVAEGAPRREDQILKLVSPIGEEAIKLALVTNPN